MNSHHGGRESSPPVEPFHTLCVLEFVTDAPQAAIEWMIAKIHAQRTAGGAELQAYSVVNRHNQEVILHIGAGTDRLLEAAELMQIKKEDSAGVLREITIAEISQFKKSEDLANFLTLAEKQQIILHELEKIRASDSDKHVPGYLKKKLYPGQSIVRKLLNDAVIHKLYPLHDRDALKRLGEEWYNKVSKPQPIDDIRTYFGETIAMYFGFLGFYTMALIPPAILGLMYYFVAWQDINRLALFAVFNVVWATIFLQVWKRKASEFAFKWGTLDRVHFEDCRAAYFGKMGINKVTGRPEPVYPKWKRVLRFYCVTIPIILSCLLFAVGVMLVYFWFQIEAEVYHAEWQTLWTKALVLVPSLLYSVAIVVMNSIYRKIAKALNDFENHRLQSAYDNHLIIKLVLFDFVNCFVVLFYIAFYMQDIPRLRSSLALLLIIQQVIGQVQESLLPYLMFRYKSNKMDKAEERRESLVDKDAKVDSDESSHVTDIISKEVRKQAEVEGEMETYEGTMDDYLEMFIQFGYVVLFSSAYPLAAVWAFINNVTEIRTDSFKLCKVFQRPFSQPTASIGAWQIAFQLMGIIAVMTNCALVALSLHNQGLLPKWDTADLVLLFVGGEHLVLGLTQVLGAMVPDLPRTVRTEMARIEFQARQAWRNERSQAARTHRVKLRRAVSLLNATPISMPPLADSKVDGTTMQHRTTNV